MSASLTHEWSVFKGSNTILPTTAWKMGTGYTYRPDRQTRNFGIDRTIITSIYNRIAIDVASVSIQHVRLDSNGRYLNTIKGSLNTCLTLSANKDQTGRCLIQDIATSLCDEGVVAVVPVDTDIDPDSGSYEIESLRVGKIMQWFPDYVQIRLYNDRTGNKEDIYQKKDKVAIIENPLYAVMNAPNSTLKRLVHKLSILDTVDEKTSSGKMDLIFQLPYVINTPAKRQQAELRRKDIEMQLENSRYGIAYTDGTEHITQLNRPVENNLLTQIEYLTNQLYAQLGLSEEVFMGTADEKTMLNYENRTIEPFLSAITDEFNRKFLTKTARTQGQAIKFFKDPFKLVPVSQLADIVDKLTRNEILSSNETRALIGYKPVDDPRADELRNKNLNQNNDETEPVTTRDSKEVDKDDS